MVSRINFSFKNVDLREYALNYEDMEKSLRFYFGAAAVMASARFVGYTSVEVLRQLDDRLEELDKTAAMTVLAALEAAFRIDYLQRCYGRKKDPVSRAFREIYKKKMARPSLEDDILVTWRETTSGATEILSALKGAFKFRHWIAHGRYWEPKLGQQYDYVTIYGLATSVLAQLPLYAL